MDDVEEAHDGGTVVGDGGAALVVVDELVHAAWPQRGAHRGRHRRARGDVAHHLRAPLRRVRPRLEQDDLRLLQNPPTKNPIHKSRASVAPNLAGRRAKAASMETGIVVLTIMDAMARSSRFRGDLGAGRWRSEVAAEGSGEGEEESSEGFSRSLGLRGRRRRGEGESSRRPPGCPMTLPLERLLAS